MSALSFQDLIPWRSFGVPLQHITARDYWKLTTEAGLVCKPHTALAWVWSLVDDVSPQATYLALLPGPLFLQALQNDETWRISFCLV